MDMYSSIAYEQARALTLRYSSSFGLASKLFAPSIRTHIYAIYGLVRLADEIVDTYQGSDTEEQLTLFETQTYNAMENGYSTNLIIHAFALTAKQYGITKDIVQPFFYSMQLDLQPQTYHQSLYETYIYGSAEVIGLMCLKVFCPTPATYEQLAPGARSLGSAYQKVNFLRDFRSDYTERHRVYFPGIDYTTFNDSQKRQIIKDIEADFTHAASAIIRLPISSRHAVEVSYAYYKELLARLDSATVATIKSSRLRLPAARKMQLFLTAGVKQGLRR